MTSNYVPADETWSRGADFAHLQSLVIYCRVDGSFAVWDGIRNRVIAPTGSTTATSFTFTPTTLWQGLSTGDVVICNGIIRDIVDWQSRQPTLTALLNRVMQVLSPADQLMRLGTPTRLSLRDARDFPTIQMPYGEIPIVHGSAAMKRILGLAYLLVWTWNEHREAARQAEVTPYSNIVLLFDEPETHLHPVWQRRVLPALFEVAGELGGKVSIQVIASTHSPLVTASLEPLFDKDRDKLLLFAVDGRDASVHEIPWAAQGDVSDWLVSPAFGLQQARSEEAEKVINVALDFVKTGPTERFPTKDDVTKALQRVLSDDDPFLIRWHAGAPQ